MVLADTRRALARLLKRRRFECDKDEGLDPRGAGSLHVESNCEGCEFELLETLLDLGYLLLLRALPAALRASCTFAESCPVDSRHACLASAVHRTGCARLTCKCRWQVCLASRLAHRAYTQNTCIRGGGAAVVRGAAEAPGNT